MLLNGALQPHKFTFVKPIFVMILLALAPTLALAEDWKTTDGMVYQDVRVMKVEDDAITILYKDGGALVPLVKLPPALQQRFDYDPAKAKIAAAARAKEESVNAKALQAEINLANKMKRDQQIKDANAISQVGTTSGTP